MRRVMWVLALAACSLWAQEQKEGASHEGGDPMLAYKWVNFAILAIGLGYVAVKVGGPALKGQQKQILEDLSNASKRAEEVAAQAAELDRRVAGLETEIASIRVKAEAELKAEGQRIESETARMLAKAETSAEQEIAMAAKEARRELKAYAADLALDLAAEKVKSRMSGETQSALVRGVVETIRAAGKPEA